MLPARSVSSQTARAAAIASLYWSRLLMATAWLIWSSSRRSARSGSRSVTLRARSKSGSDALTSPFIRAETVSTCSAQPVAQSSSASSATTSADSAIRRSGGELAEVVVQRGRGRRAAGPGASR